MGNQFGLQQAQPSGIGLDICSDFEGIANGKTYPVQWFVSIVDELREVKGIASPTGLPAWVENQLSIEQAARLIFDRFAEFPPEGEVLVTKLYAEIHSLIRIGINKADRVIFLTSDTDEGKACANSLKLYLEKYFDGILVEIRNVDGLQVHDADMFRRKGVVNFERSCLDAVRDYGAKNVILNPTGGYKALVPYTVLVGMIKSVPCRYIFEQSSQLLTLPPLPVTFDRSLFERYRHLIERIERETSISTADWEKGVQYNDRSMLEPLVERTNTDVTLSAVGLLLIDEVKSPSALVPFLSREAWRDCLENLSKLPDCNPFRFLLRVAADRNQLNLAEHINAGSGLRWLKPGRTTDRYLISVKGWRLLVWRAIREDEIGPDYPQKVKVNPGNGSHSIGQFTRLEAEDI